MDLLQSIMRGEDETITRERMAATHTVYGNAAAYNLQCGNTLQVEGDDRHGYIYTGMWNDSTGEASIIIAAAPNERPWAEVSAHTITDAYELEDIMQYVQRFIAAA